jgi:NAD(P)-dependent dehydrogenase (short-subunit alcohol dehydrogenase family)
MNVVIAARDDEAGTAAAGEIREQACGACVFHRCDVSEAAEVKALVRFAAETFQRVDVLVNNAGYMPAHADACDMPLDAYEQVLRTNLFGAFYGCKYAIPHLRKTGGSIVNISSILAEVGQEQTAGYTSAKGGLDSLTRTLAIEEARHGVRVNCILPGHIVTELFWKEKQRAADPQEYERSASQSSWMGRGGMPLEVGTTALFLASPWAGYITGAMIPVTGAFELGAGQKIYRKAKEAE